MEQAEGAHLAHAKDGELVGVGGAAAAACLRPHARQPLPPRLRERVVRGGPQGAADRVNRDRQLEDTPLPGKGCGQDGSSGSAAEVRLDL